MFIGQLVLNLLLTNHDAAFFVITMQTSSDIFCLNRDFQGNGKAAKGVDISMKKHILKILILNC